MAKPWQVESEFEELLKILKPYAPGKLLEIGSYEGGTAEAFRDLGFNVTCIEISPKEELLSIPGITVVKGDSSDPKIIDRRLRFDVLFIDGDHSYEQVKLDYENWSPLVVRGGLIVFHDIVDSDLHRQQECEVPKFWKEIKGEGYIEIIHDGSWGGVGCITKT